MKEKERIILKFLSSQDTWVTSFSISALSGLSVRSVKTYIADVNAAHPGLVSSSRRGFWAQDKKRLAEALKSTKAGAHLPQTAEDRKNYILRKLLLEQEHYDLDLLAGELSISPVTLLNELPRLKGDLAEYELAIKTKNNRAAIAGPEANKKKMISKLIYEDAQDSFLSIKLMQGYMPHYDLTHVRSIVFTALREHQYFMDDFSLLNLVLHIAITMERHRWDQTILEDEASGPKTLVNAHIRAIMADIAAQLQHSFQISLSQREIYDFSLLMMTRVMQDFAGEIRPEELHQVVGERVTRLVSLMQQETGKMFNITITNPDFTVRFSLHIKNLLIRLENSIRLRNPQMSEIKNTYPFIYDVSVYLASILTRETGFPVSEDEISYIALHLGVLIEERKVIKNEVRAILLNPQYFYNSLDLAEKCAQIFENNLLITGLVCAEDELDTYSDYDLIISTIPLAAFTGRPFVQISGHLANKDILTVSNKIDEILKARIKGRVEAKIKLMFREELFYAGREFKGRDDALNTMADDLAAMGFVDPGFKQKLFERERVSSSAYANIAMPHPLEMCAFTSAIGVSLHPGGLPWNHTKVNIVFLLAINIRDRLFFKDIFDFITEVISDDRSLMMLLEAKTYDEFVDILVSFAK